MCPLHLVVWPASQGEAVQRDVQLQKSKNGSIPDGSRPRKGLLPPPVTDWGNFISLQSASCLFLCLRYGGILRLTSLRMTPGVLGEGSPHSGLLINLCNQMSSLSQRVTPGVVDIGVNEEVNPFRFNCYCSKRCCIFEELCIPECWMVTSRSIFPNSGGLGAQRDSCVVDVPGIDNLQCKWQKWAYSGRAWTCPAPGEQVLDPKLDNIQKTQK